MTTEQIQCLLTYLGWNPGGVDGIPGSRTAAALAAFQKSAGLEATGRGNPETEAALRKAVAGEETGNFWQDIFYFRREEFRCGCKGKFCSGFPAEPAEKLVRLAEQLREELGQPILISSGVRCPAHNRAVKGVENSRHLQGKAMDFMSPNDTAETLLAKVRALPGVRYAYAIDSRYVHMDIA